MKYVIITQQGSGSNLLRTFLNSHDDIYFADELFVTRRDGTGEFQKSNKMIKKFLDDFYNRKDKVVGFDLKYNQINDEILEYIEENKIKVIQLKRDIARTFIKNNLRNKTCNLKDLKNYSNTIKQRMFLTSKGFNCKEIYYEDMTRGRDIIELPLDFEKDLLKYFNVKYQKLNLENKNKELKLNYN